MKKVSVRTLLLLVELLAVVAVHQFVTWAPSAQAALVWLDEEPDEPVDPNVPDDPENPEPESVGTVATRVWLDEEPQDPNDAENPQPEAATPLPVL